MKEIKQIMDSDIMIIISFIAEILFIIGFPITIYRFIKKYKILFNQNSIKSILVIFIILMIGLIAPLILILDSFINNWSDWVFWVAQILSWYSLLSFILLIIFIIKARNILRDFENQTIS